MSNTRSVKKPTGATGKGSLAQYRQEAGGHPFRLYTDEEDHFIDIPRPTGNTLMELAARYSGLDIDNPTNVDPRSLLRDILGDKYEEVMVVIGPEDMGVLVAFIRDVAQHFQLGEALASLA